MELEQGRFIIKTYCLHAKNERLYNSLGHDSVVDLVCIIQLSERRREFVQFASIFWLLREGHPMADFRALRDLFDLLRLKHNLRKHWCDNFGWEITDVMHSIVL